MSLLDYCVTDKQREVISLHESEGLTGEEIGRRLGRDPANCRSVIRRIRGKALEAHGVAPDYGMMEGYPDGLNFTKATFHRKADGTIIQTWDRASKDKEDAYRVAEQIAQEHPVTPISEIPAPSTETFNTDIIPWYQIGDAHLGMLAHESQVGHNFDLEIGKRELKYALAHLIKTSEPCERCVINDLGDSAHFDNEAAVTAKSGHPLDASGPLFDVAECYAECMHFVIDAALQKHYYVDVAIVPGNHNEVIARVTAINLRKYYENNPRVTVLDNRSVFIPYRMGNTFVLLHHGHKCKPQKLASIMANDYAQDWGETFYHYIDGGHVHHSQTKKEDNGAIWETWNQMAPSDKYAHEGGWRSRQMLTRVYRSKTYGEKGRETITAEEVRDRIYKRIPGATCNKRRRVHTV